MSEREKQQTFQAAVAAIHIINRRHEALNKYRNEVLTYAANNPGNYSLFIQYGFYEGQ